MSILAKKMTTETSSKLYGAKDPRELPNHSLSEAAAYLRVPRSTLRAWLLGQGEFKAVLDIAVRLLETEPRPFIAKVSRSGTVTLAP